MSGGARLSRGRMRRQVGPTHRHALRRPSEKKTWAGMLLQQSGKSGALVVGAALRHQRRDLCSPHPPEAGRDECILKSGDSLVAATRRGRARLPVPKWGQNTRRAARARALPAQSPGAGGARGGTPPSACGPLSTARLPTRNPVTSGAALGLPSRTPAQPLKLGARTGPSGPSADMPASARARGGARAAGPASPIRRARRRASSRPGRPARRPRAAAPAAPACRRPRAARAPRARPPPPSPARPAGARQFRPGQGGDGTADQTRALRNKLGTAALSQARATRAAAPGSRAVHPAVASVGRVVASSGAHLQAQGARRQGPVRRGRGQRGRQRRRRRHRPRQRQTVVGRQRSAARARRPRAAAVQAERPGRRQRHLRLWRRLAPGGAAVERVARRGRPRARLVQRDRRRQARRGRAGGRGGRGRARGRLWGRGRPGRGELRLAQLGGGVREEAHWARAHRAVVAELRAVPARVAQVPVRCRLHGTCSAPYARRVPAAAAPVCRRRRPARQRARSTRGGAGGERMRIQTTPFLK